MNEKQERGSVNIINVIIFILKNIVTHFIVLHVYQIHAHKNLI